MVVQSKNMPRKKKHLCVLTVPTILLSFVVFAFLLNHQDFYDNEKKSDLGPNNTLADLNCSCPDLEQKRCLDMKGDFFLDHKVEQRVNNCQSYFDSIHTAAFLPATVEEKATPLAFGILAHGNMGILEAQLSSIFRPHNCYCLYLDPKASKKFLVTVGKLVQCYKSHFPQACIFVYEKARPIYWSHISILAADLACIKLLLRDDAAEKARSNWKYFINQAGTALPTIPVQIMAQRLFQFRDKAGYPMDSIMSRPVPDKYRYRYLYRFNFRPSTTSQIESPREIPSNHYLYNRLPILTDDLSGTPPFNLKIFKGFKESIITRKTARFFTSSPVALEFQRWIGRIAFAEEFYFATLIRVSQEIYEANATVVQDDNPEYNDVYYDMCPRRSLWVTDEEKSECHGLVKRWVCNLALMDLPQLYQEKVCFFANKFDVKVDPKAVSCMHQLTTNSTQ